MKNFAKDMLEVFVEVALAIGISMLIAHWIELKDGIEVWSTVMMPRIIFLFSHMIVRSVVELVKDYAILRILQTKYKEMIMAKNN